MNAEHVTDHVIDSNKEAIAEQLALLTRHDGWHYEAGRYVTGQIVAVSQRVNDMRAVLAKILAPDHATDVKVEHLWNATPDTSSPMYYDLVSLPENAINYNTLAHLTGAVAEQVFA